MRPAGQPGALPPQDVNPQTSAKGRCGAGLGKGVVPAPSVLLPWAAGHLYNESMLTKEMLETSLKEAMRARDDVRRRTLRMILSAVKLAEVDRRGPLDEPGLLAVLGREAKTRQETITDAERAGRSDLAEAARAELAIVEAYLPKPLTAEEMEALARKSIAETGATTPADMGRVMKALMPQIQGRADGKTASDLVRRLLSPT